MILDVDQETQRARPIAPFSNGTEGDAWLERWCHRCANDHGESCPLVLVSYLGLTPAAWEPDQPHSLGAQYRCVEFLAPGYRRVQAGGQVMQWTGTAWRHVTRAELDREAWRAR